MIVTDRRHMLYRLIHPSVSPQLYIAYSLHILTSYLYLSTPCFSVNLFVDVGVAEESISTGTILCVPTAYLQWLLTQCYYSRLAPTYMLAFGAQAGAAYCMFGLGAPECIMCTCWPVIRSIGVGIEVMLGDCMPRRS